MSRRNLKNEQWYFMNILKFSLEIVFLLTMISTAPDSCVTFLSTLSTKPFLSAGAAGEASENFLKIYSLAVVTRISNTGAIGNDDI